MDHMSLSDELRKQLIENAAWGKVGITPRIDEDVETEQLDERGSKKGDKPAKKKKGDKPDYTTDERKGDKSKSDPGEKDYENAGTEYEDGEYAEELEEAVHVCPLCTSQLDESIDEERILEHLNVVLGLVDRLSQMNEEEEDIDEVINQTLEALLLGSDDEEDE